MYLVQLRLVNLVMLIVDDQMSIYKCLWPMIDQVHFLKLIQIELLQLL